ncbi:MAG: DUF3168 domain-containing protein [Rhodobacteraceae bacterium]|jgi:hypothetical protein|nr:DUF3168 domain-containing protein [Paracoccaceae bacterium]QPI85891.1 DUF3168 domain-containing protein [Rhodobacterales bacterium HKCCA1288]
MSYGASAALQQALFDRLSGNPTLNTLLGGAIFDALPEGSLPSLYLMIGPEEARQFSDISAGGAVHEFALTIVGGEAGFLSAKQAAVAASDALLGAPNLTLSRGRLINLDFLRARARKTDTAREIELWFRALIDDVA